VVSTEAELGRAPTTVRVQSRGQDPRMVEANHCLVTPEGAYPHPGVYRASYDLRVAQLRLAQKELPPHKSKLGSLPQAPSLLPPWDSGSKAAWFSSVVKFRHRCQAAGEQCRVRDKEILHLLAQVWERGGRSLPQYMATLISPGLVCGQFSMTGRF
jgi:hypothetical protein